MTETSRRRADTTRQRPIAASRQFTHCCYSMASLDNIRAEAELTNRTKYFRVP
jgi:hypothetical protein